MSKNTLSSLVRPTLLLAAFPLLTQCSSDDLCPDDAKARIDALSVAAADFEAAAADIELELITACTAIAIAGGETVADDADIGVACDAAADVLVSIQGQFEIEIIPPECYLDLEAQVSCEADCQIDASCDPGSIEVRCEPGKFNVQCEPVNCSGEVSCEGSASVAVSCEGTCSATCEGSCTAEISGTCEGTCNGTCNGTESSGECNGVCEGTCEGNVKAECYGSCEGSCKGTCTADASAEFSCESDFRCTGGCSEPEVKLPRCEGEITPPSCDVDADCQASCDAEVSMDAQCTPGQVNITGDIDVTLKAALEANLPRIDVIFQKTGFLLQSGANLASAFGGAVNAGVGCAVSMGGDIVASAQATLSASVKVEASFSASASISGSAN